MRPVPIVIYWVIILIYEIITAYDLPVWKGLGISKVRVPIVDASVQNGNCRAMARELNIIVVNHLPGLVSVC